MDFLMPKLSDTMEEGTVLQWLRDDGAEVAKGEPIVEIETDKANMMVEAPEGGALAIIAQVGDTLPIGAPIATIGGSAASAPAPPAIAAEPATGIPTADDGTGSSIGLEVRPPEVYPGAHDEPEPAAPAPTASHPAPPAPPREPAPAHVPASPLARRLAEELGVDLTRVRGSGPAGRVIREDVEAAAAQIHTPTPTGSREAGAAEATPAPAPTAAATAPGERTPLTRLQRTIARRMAESKPGAPHFYLERDVDATSLLMLRAELVAASPEGEGPSVNDLIVRAVAMAAAEHPEAVRRFDGDALVAPSGIHVGIAVTVPGGLLVPVVRNADALRVGDLAAAVRDLVVRCRDGRITPPELEGSAITVSNLGMFGVDRFSAVINPPEAAILAVGRAKPAPVVIDGAVVVRDVMSVTLSVDHRALYGAEAAVLLRRIAELLERPGALVL